MSVRSAQARRFLSPLLLLASGLVFAQSHEEEPPAEQMVIAASAASDGKEPWEETDRRIQASQKVSALGNNLFGDQVSNSNGTLSFSVTDVSLPGNNSLPVGITRTFKVENHAAEYVTGRTGYASDFMLADWDIEIPSISGIFAADWVASGSSPQNRCSAGTVPPSLTVNSQVVLTESYWHGNTVTLLQGGGELLLANGTAPKPSNGTTYVWTTPDAAYLSCLSTVKNTTGEGFLAIDSNGTKYWFDWMAQYKEPNLKVAKATPGYLYVTRRRNVLYPTRIEDRFGNYVTYTYTNAYNQPAKLTAIAASDGRAITLSYNSANRVSSITADGRSWTYAYAANGDKDTLASVTLPDTRKWTLNFSGLANTYLWFEPSTAQNPSRTCIGDGGPIGQTTFSGSVTHPSGATGTFVVAATMHGRSNVPLICEGFITPARQIYAETAHWPFYYYAYSLQSKTINGPGIPQQTWTYTYAGNISYFYPSGSSYSFPVCTYGVDCSAPQCTSDSCAGKSITTVTGPTGEWTRFLYGNSYRYNEGKFLGVEQGIGNTTLSSRTHGYDLSQQDKAYPARQGTSLKSRNDGFTSEFPRPLLSTTTVQDGATFQSVSNTLDNFARPVQVVRSGPSGTRTDTTEYHDNTAKWILGQVAKVTNTTTGLVESQTSYDGNAMPLQNRAFGKLQQTLTYNADGTVATVKDGNNNVTTLASWKRGIPQSITFADGQARAAAVNNSGWITSTTDENGYTTQYTYDAMGRLASVVYPTGDSTAWNTATQVFEPVNVAEYGIAAGHWRQTVSTGNARKLTYFDALWRPLLTREYDTANEAGTQRFQRFAYDHEGRTTFASYPGSGSTLTTGTWSEYDALGRPTSVSQDSELGVLTTLTQYLGGFKTRTTNPRGQQTTTSYMAWDQPTTDYPVAVVQPEGVYTDIARDVFGKPTAITQRNAASSVSVTRRYVYDNYQQLCKSIEPETGSTVMAYDNAGNLSWSASGQALPSASSCDTASVAANQKVSRSYDARNRLTTLSFPDNNGSQSWTYTADGLPNTVTTQNEGGSSTVTNSYAYNKRRLLTSESQSQTAGQAVWSIDYGYNGNGHVSGMVYPQSLTVDYAPNALGQPTKAGSFATGVQYYPNGAIKQFTYGNGRVHTLTQNARQLPSRSTDSGGVLDVGYAYDKNGNVASMTDYTPAGRQTRSMGYDNRDRLTTVTSPLYPGGASYTYDVLDNLTRTKVAGRDHGYWYDASNRLTNVLNGPGGPSVIGLGYDARGNLSNKNGQLYSFDHGNRLRSALGTQTYRYDALGRRVRTASPAGVLYEVYSQDGKLRWQRDEQAGERLHHIYLSGSLVATRRMPMGDTTATVTYQHTDALGSPIASTNETGTVIQTTEHEPYGHQLNRSNDNRPGYTGHVMDQATGLVQMQQRYYDPGLGRFLSVDPVTAYSNPVGAFNRYRYAKNNPYRYIDPDGRVDWEKVGDGFKLEGSVGLGLSAKIKLGPIKAALGLGSMRFGGGATAAPDVYAFQEVAGPTGVIEMGSYAAGYKGSVDRSYQGRLGHSYSEEKSSSGFVLGRKSAEMSVDGDGNSEISASVTAIFVNGTASIDFGKIAEGLTSDSPSKPGRVSNGHAGGFKGVFRVEGRIDSNKIDRQR